MYINFYQKTNKQTKDELQGQKSRCAILHTKRDIFNYSFIWTTHLITKYIVKPISNILMSSCRFHVRILGRGNNALII